MSAVTRERVILAAVVVVLVVLAVSRQVITAQTFLLLGVAIPSIILHEVSHGVAALWFGDDTAKRAGRITLNPLPHIDIFGTLILPAILALSGLGVFGYAKPVPINPNRMRHPQDDAVVVSLVGPATNLALALLSALWLRQVNPSQLAFDSGPWAMRIPLALGFVNVVLGVFNLLPVPPLDGSAVVGRFLPQQWQHGWSQVRRYGMVVLIVVVLLVPGLLSRVFTPAENLWLRLVIR
jgi:Zn-dependent protease